MINNHNDDSFAFYGINSDSIVDQSNIDIETIKSLIRNLNEAQEIAQIGHWKLNINTNELFWSDETYRIFGLKPKEVKPSYENFFTFVHEDDRSLVNDAYIKSLEDKSPYSIIHRIITKDKKLKYVEERCVHKLDESGNVVKSIGTVHDITERVEHEKELEIASNVFKYSSDGIVITDKNNNIVSVNKSFEKLTGYSKEEIIGKNPKLLSSGWGDEEFYKNMWSSLLSNDLWRDELWDRKKDGSLYAIEQTIICVRDKNQDIVNYIGMSRDITEAKNKEEKIHQLAFYDFLTKLPNAKLFQQEVEAYIKSTHYNNETFAILFLDLDNFKWVNDSLGHQIGDLLLIEIAAKLKEIISQDSIISRLGGDEFVILAPYENLLTISQLANTILCSVKDPIKVQNREVNVSWSIGISLYPQNGENYNDLLKNADAAMYESKNRGKNTFRYFNDMMNQDAMYRLELDTKLRYAITNNSFFLNYQPKYSFEHGKTIGVEALIRWIDKDLGFIAPDKFIPIAEESSYINEIGSWVMKQALNDLKIINSKLSSPISISINVSGKQLEHESFYDEARTLLKESGIEPSLVEFEITETSIMQNIDHVVDILKKIKMLGVKISIDDFGTGYSSMSYLKKLPIDTLKIDREFIKELEIDEDSKSIVNAIIALAKSFKLTTVAEGVENEEQKLILDGLNCDMTQGYLYSRPLSLDDLLAFLS
ncbi:diguanylate cyclase/phosphodiesterase with PAS/PAC sensor(s) [Sulfurimonas denitrificans DSM 1251]|uniref:Diguanylate cyclase/phosphodiesterase with PAS/PAC sensor(S) n=1 Tax=Sulfurimonas denitrificans (strain ATCC 33889 / DSM 1251) TaxID=326298 RepID=Q30T73_SULDN|nr:bifunctional diguanylate cyclase/phosphodiesterase [Sulfurimonas denitrificans]ABB43808.1 diguanylate cyclase/phosphodiesterase with PAS/PAC sensor(s) [Sulfurimonas denitrificans DSM 1251]MDD3442480.1 EAL domain-containing protein [Sulfurimonas denitrificans]